MPQLIFVFETNASAKTDYIYVKKCIDVFYGERSFKLTPIYAGCKSKLIQQQSKIVKNKEHYLGKTNVIIVSDVDEGDDLQNQKLIKYCMANNFKLVWMNLDIEDVFLGKRVKKSEKDTWSRKFLFCFEETIKRVNLRSKNVLAESHSSNLLNVIDECVK